MSKDIIVKTMLYRMLPGVKVPFPNRTYLKSSTMGLRGLNEINVLYLELPKKESG